MGPQRPASAAGARYGGKKKRSVARPGPTCDNSLSTTIRQAACETGHWTRQTNGRQDELQGACRHSGVVEGETSERGSPQRPQARSIT